MRLNDLLREIQYTRLVLPKDEVEVKSVNIDSRLVEADIARVCHARSARIGK